MSGSTDTESCYQKIVEMISEGKKMKKRQTRRKKQQNSKRCKKLILYLNVRFVIFYFYFIVNIYVKYSFRFD